MGLHAVRRQQEPADNILCAGGSPGAPDESDNFGLEADEAFAHVERDTPSGQDLQLGSWIERRIWLDFDLGPSLVPVDGFRRYTLTVMGI